MNTPDHHTIRCTDCTHSDRNTQGAVPLICRLHPPVVYPHADHGFRTAWPEVSTEDWCAEGTRRPERVDPASDYTR